MVVFLTTFFIFGIFSTVVIEQPSKTQSVIIYSNQTRSNLKNVFLKALSKAKKSVMIHTFALTDPQILRQLLSNQKQGLQIEVLSDFRNLPIHYPLFKNTLEWQAIKTAGLFHQKILLVDDATCYLGTANMTYESLKMHDNLVIGFYSPPLNEYLRKHTQKIPCKKDKKTTSKQLFDLDNQHLELWMLPFKGSQPLDRLIELIDQACESIHISMFTLTHPKILEALKNAHKKGVQLHIFVDKTSALGASAKAIENLKNASIDVKISQGLQLLHHKMMLIDTQCLVVGSANWTKSAFEKNHDFFLVLSPLLLPQKKQLLAIFSSIEQEAK